MGKQLAGRMYKEPLTKNLLAFGQRPGNTRHNEKQPGIIGWPVNLPHTTTLLRKTHIINTYETNRVVILTLMLQQNRGKAKKPYSINKNKTTQTIGQLIISFHRTNEADRFFLYTIGLTNKTYTTIQALKQLNRSAG